MTTENTQSKTDIHQNSRFNPIPLVITVAIMLVLIGSYVRSYSSDVLMPRYCENPIETLYYLNKVLSEREPAGNEARRPYLIAAKLIFLVPQEFEESRDDYLYRVRIHIERHCS